MATSNTYEFGSNAAIDDLLRESFERIGIIGNELTGLQVQSAIMSANLELTAWQGKVPLSWTRKRFMTSLYVNQPTYLVPVRVTRIVDVVASQPIRLNTGGTAFSSSGGNAANCFDPNATAGCVQTAPNGYIYYDYGIGNNQSIQFVGITGLTAFDSTYQLVVEYSFDNTNWTEAYKAPAQTYSVNKTVWLVIENTINARTWRIREVGGATLKIQQIYLDIPTNTGTGDRWLQPLSYTEWMQIPTKNNFGFPSSYFFNEQIQPTITLWPVPGPNSLANQFTALLYDGYQYSQDVTNLFNQFDVPQRFYDALVSGIAYRLATKFAPDKVQLKKQESDEAFQLATLTEFQGVPLRFQPDLSYYG